MTEQTAQPKPHKKRQRLTPHERERLIIKGAVEFIADRGLGFSTRELANYLGVSQSLLFRYFSTKEELVDKIYETVYLGRWNPEWDEILADRTRPMQERLEKYLQDYSRVVLQKDWVRIFLLSAFEDPVISQRYIVLLRKRIFLPILKEQLHELELKPIESEADLEMAIELIWGFHSSFFYLGVRQWIFKTPTKVSRELLIKRRVEAFLSGFTSYLISVSSSKPNN